MKILLPHILLLFLILSGCKSSQTRNNESSSNLNIENKILSEKYSGYLKGSILYKPNNSCNYILTDIDTGITYDPINLSDKKFEAYHNKNSIVYFTFHPLRRPNRCLDGLPVQILKIAQRTE